MDSVKLHYWLFGYNDRMVMWQSNQSSSKINNSSEDVFRALAIIPASIPSPVLLPPPLNFTSPGCPLPICSTCLCGVGTGRRGALSGFIIMFHSYDYISLFVSFVYISVSIDNLFQRICSINDRFYLSRLHKLFK